jgi:branched-chain amino acid transport system permease protein
MGLARGLVRSFLPYLVGIPLLLGLEWVLGRTGMDAWKVLLTYVAVNIVLAVSLNIVNGFTGQFSLGHAGFMAVGGYAAAKISLSFGEAPLAGLPAALSGGLVFFVSLAAGMLAAALAGLVVGIPSLRLRGDYLAIVTLGFGQIILSIIENVNALGGALGLQGLPPLTTLTWAGVGAIATISVARRLAVSTQGRALFAIREDEIAAEAMGVDTTGYKVRAFVISSAFAGLAGGLIVHQLLQATTGSFNFARTIEVLVMVVLGGLGSITGSVLAATFLTIFLQLLQRNSTLAQYQMVIYAALLIALMLIRPQGLFGTRELWDLPVFRRLPWRRLGVRPAAAGASPTGARSDEGAGGTP